MGVDILMETSIPRVLRGNQMPLQNDDFGGRQFLYPSRFVEVPGDYDHDGIVGPADYQKWLDQFGKRGIGLAADGDDNGIVDAGDYIVWRNHFDTVIVIEDTSPVPEPATGIAAMLGLLIGSLFLNGRAPRPR
jgi:hypothetical protein